MDINLITSLENILSLTYPEQWATSWLSLPAPQPYIGSPYYFNVICTDLPNKCGKLKTWPPIAAKPLIWLQWENDTKTGFWIRSRKFDPLLRDRFILIEFNEIEEATRSGAVNLTSIRNACSFSDITKRVIWHNPLKGGSSSPQSAHYQTIPLFKHAKSCEYSLPCFMYEPLDSPWYINNNISYSIILKGFNKHQFPVLGVVISGPIDLVANKVWTIIYEYDSALSCNLIFQPSPSFCLNNRIRVFIFPRNRNSVNTLVLSNFLNDDEQVLLNNNRGGEYKSWPFAGIELGLLTQIEYGPLFKIFEANSIQWGNTLFRLLGDLTLDENSVDWIDFKSTVINCF